MLYDLDSLHWQEFEQLVKYYLKMHIGEGVWVFDGSKDMGRDAVFSGVSNDYPSRSAPYSGDWIFQVKHRTIRNQTQRRAETKLLSDLSDELQKIFTKHNFKCDHYIYITNLNVSNRFRDQALQKFNDFCQSRGLKNKNFHVIEYKDLEVFISQNAPMRYRFPSLLSFTDVEKVFHKKEELKNAAYLKFVRANIEKFVSTTHYIEAVDRLHNFNFLMLVGDIKSGKTTVIEALALSFLEEGLYKPYFIRNTDELFNIASLLDPSESALFICDDIFGQHELDPIKLADWSNYFKTVMGLIEANRKFLFTTRRYIYEEFANKSGLRLFFPEEDDPERLVVRLKELTQEEREQILEKHILHSTLGSKKSTLVMQYKDLILSCKDFSPEVIRSLVGVIAKTKLSDIPTIIAQHISNPDQYLFEFFNKLAFEKRLLILSLAIAPTNEVQEVENTYLILLKDTNQLPALIFEAFISEIDGSIIKRKDYIVSSELEFYHPSMYEVVIDICKQDKFYRKLLLNNVNLETVSLVSIRPTNERSRRIQVYVDEFDILTDGVRRFIARNIDLLEVIRVIRWVNRLNVDVPFDPRFLVPFKQLKGSLKSIVVEIEFFEAHCNEPVERWIDLLDNWNIFASGSSIKYAEKLEERFCHVGQDSYDYWRLCFLIEGINPGFIEKTVPKEAMQQFVDLLIQRAHGLRLGLNIIGMKPNTHEQWLPLFREVDDLISKMKRSGLGQKLIGNHILEDWDQVSQQGEFAKNRHAGMVKVGHWKTYKRIRNYKFMSSTDFN
jgi:hypothetical protein